MATLKSPLNVVFVSYGVTRDFLFRSVLESAHDVNLTWVASDARNRANVEAWGAQVITSTVYWGVHAKKEELSEEIVAAIASADVLIADTWSYTVAYKVWCTAAKRPFVVMRGASGMDSMSACIYANDLRYLGKQYQTGYHHPGADATWCIPVDMFNDKDSLPAVQEAGKYMHGHRLPCIDGFVVLLEILRQRLAPEKTNK